MDTEDIDILRYNRVKFASEIARFNCGDPRFTLFLKNAKNFGTTFLFVAKETQEIIGFISFCCGSMKRNDAIESAIEIKLFAFDKKWHGKADSNKQTIADKYLRIFIRYFTRLSAKTIKADCIMLHSVPRAVRFYEKFGFKKLISSDSTGKKVLVGRFEENCEPMFLMIDSA